MTSPGNISLPPDQSFRKIQRDQTTILLSVSEEGVHFGSGSDYGKDIQNSPKGFHIFAEKVHLNGPFSVTLNPTQTLATLSTHSLSLDKDAVSVFIVSGAPGISNDEGAERKDTIDGKGSGYLAVYVEDCSTDVARLIQYSANGGDGGNTIEKTGNAGNGGQGGSVQWVGYSAFAGLSTLLYTFAINKVLNKELPESAILTPSHPIMSYLKAALTIADLIPRPKSSGPDIKSIVDIIKPIRSIVQSVGSATVKDARAAVWEVRQDITKQYQADQRAIESRISVLGGNAGSVKPRLDAGERGSAGKPGQHGTRTVTLLREVSSKKLHDQNFPFVHPEQCQMLYDRAMVYWYFGRNTLAIELLSRLLLRLSFLRQLQDSDNLAKAYASQEGALRTKDNVSALKSLLNSVSRQLSVLQSEKVDYYGNTAHWVPRVSYEEYNNYIDDAMNVFQKIETSYIKYHAALETQQSVNEVIHQTKAQLDTSIAAVGKERETLLQQLKDLDKKIELAGPVVEEKHRQFQAEYTEFAKEVKEAHKFTPEQIFNALGSIASIGNAGWGAAMGVIQGVSLAHDWETKYPDDQGNFVNKKYLINQIRRSLATGLADFNAEFQTDKLSGDFKLDDKLPQFLMEESQLDDILSDYSTASFADAGDQLKQYYKDFTDALTARNNDILSYNSIIQTITTQDQEVAQMREMRNMADRGEIINEDLEQMTGYIRVLFQNARARVMRYLALGRRALTFKILRTEDLLDMSDGSATARLDIPLSVTSDVLLTIRSNLSHLLLTATEDNSGEPAQFPADWNTGQGKHRYLSEDELQVFLAQKRVTIHISHVINTLSSGFANAMNVRIYRVRFTLVGMRAIEGTSEGLMKSLITHGGVETIVSRGGNPVFFEHSPLDTLHSYYVNGNGDTVSTLDDGTLVHRGSTDRAPIFGAPGPFTKWTVDASSADWHDLDTSNVTGAYLEFFGTNYAPQPIA